MTRSRLIYLDGCTTCALFGADGTVEHHVHPDIEGAEDEADGDGFSLMDILGMKTEQELSHYIVGSVATAATKIRNGINMIGGMEDLALAAETIRLIAAIVNESKVGTVTITEHDLPPPGRTKH